MSDERASEDEIRATGEIIKSMAQLAMLVSDELVSKLQREVRLSHALQPVLDPTGYMQQLDGLRMYEQQLAAFVAFRKAIKASIGDFIGATVEERE